MCEKSGWERWKDMAARAATFQARVLLVVFYWVVISPFAVVLRLFADPLEIGPGRGGHWHRPPSSKPPSLH